MKASFSAALLPLLLSCSSSAPSDQAVPVVTFDDLKRVAESEGNDHSYESLKDPGGRVGVFAVTSLPSGNLGEAHETFMAEAPGCLASQKTPLGLPTLPMFDGSKRTTLATESGEFPDCFTTIPGMSRAFDLVEDMVSKTLQRMVGKPLEYVTSDRRVALGDAPVKEHIHVYENSISGANGTTGNNGAMVPYHTDNGIFLILSPFPDHGLDVKLSDGQRVSTSWLAPGSLLVLMGRGLTEWLLQNGAYAASDDLFHPVPHSVPSMAGRGVTVRSVYARMKVAQADAIPLPLINIVKDRQHKTFQDVFMEVGEKPEALCRVQPDLPLRSFWIRSADTMCRTGTAFCWNTCLELPPECLEAAVCRNDAGECGPSAHMDHSCTMRCN